MYENNLLKFIYRAFLEFDIYWIWFKKNCQRFFFLVFWISSYFLFESNSVNEYKANIFKTLIEVNVCQRFDHFQIKGKFIFVQNVFEWINIWDFWYCFGFTILPFYILIKNKFKMFWVCLIEMGCNAPLVCVFLSII